MENCSICNSDYKKAFKSDHYKSVKHLKKLNQFYCKKCNSYMPLLEKSSPLNSDEHKNKTQQRRVRCEDCNRYIYLIKQDISKVKFIYKTVKTVNKTIYKTPSVME